MTSGNNTSVLTSSSASSPSSFNAFQIIQITAASIGLFGNLLNFIVLGSYRGMRFSSVSTSTSTSSSGSTCSSDSTAGVNLLGLALADFLICLAALPLALRSSTLNLYTNWPITLYWVYGPGIVSALMSVGSWMVVLMSIVRYLAVCQPLKSRHALTVRNMIRTIILFYLLAFLIHSPRLTFYTYTTKITTPHANQSTANNSLITYMIHYRSYWKDRFKIIIYYSVSIALDNVIPFLIVLIANIAIIIACKRSEQCRATLVVDMSRGQSSSSQYTSSSGNSFQDRVRRARSRISSLRDRKQNSADSCQRPDHHSQHCRPGNVYNKNNCVYLEKSRISIRRMKRSSTRVTPLLVSVILLFLLFIAPFGTVQLICYIGIKSLSSRIREDPGALLTYKRLNTVIDWSNSLQLVGYACNFFLYFLVSTSFRRNTRRLGSRFNRRLTYCSSVLSACCRNCWSLHSLSPPPPNRYSTTPTISTTSNSTTRPLSARLVRSSTSWLTRKPHSDRGRRTVSVMDQHHLTHSNRACTSRTRFCWYSPMDVEHRRPQSASPYVNITDCLSTSSDSGNELAHCDCHYCWCYCQCSGRRGGGGNKSFSAEPSRTKTHRNTINSSLLASTSEWTDLGGRGRKSGLQSAPVRSLQSVLQSGLTNADNITNANDCDYCLVSSQQRSEEEEEEHADCPHKLCHYCWYKNCHYVVNPQLCSEQHQSETRVQPDPHPIPSPDNHFTSAPDDNQVGPIGECSASMAVSKDHGFEPGVDNNDNVEE